MAADPCSVGTSSRELAQREGLKRFPTGTAWIAARERRFPSEPTT